MLPSTDSSLLSGGEKKRKRSIVVESEHMKGFHSRQSVRLQAVYLYSKTGSSWRGRTTFSSTASDQSCPAEGDSLGAVALLHAMMMLYIVKQIITFLLSHPLMTTGQLGSLLADWHLFPNVCTFPLLSWRGRNTFVCINSFTVSQPHNANKHKPL